MNAASANVLLKKLEDPPENVLFILVMPRRSVCCRPYAATVYASLSALLLDKGEYAAHYEQFIQHIANPRLPIPGNWNHCRWPERCSKRICLLVRYRTMGEIRYYLNQLPAIQALNEQINLRACVTFMRELNTKQQLSRHPLNPCLFLEGVFIAYVALMRGE